MSRLLRLYPAIWRARYEGDLLALLEERPPSLLDRLDLVRGAVDARLHPQLVSPDALAPDHAGRWRRSGAAALGGLLWVAAALGFYTAPYIDGLGYKDSGAVVVIAAAAAAGSGLAALLRSRGQGSRLLSGAAFMILLGAIGVALPWPILLLGFYSIVVGSILFGLVATTRLGPVWLLVTLGALLAAGFNTEDTRALLLVPLGLAWIVVGALDARGQFALPRARRRPA